MEYSFISQAKFDQIVEQHLNGLSKADRSVITNKMAEQIIHLIENNFEDNSADCNVIRWLWQFVIRTINERKFLHKNVSRKHQRFELRVCTREEMYQTFCHVHNGDAGEGHQGQNATWFSLNQQYCFFPQAISHAACKACSVCCSSVTIQKHLEGKPIIAERFLQRVQVIIFFSTILQVDILSELIKLLIISQFIQETFILILTYRYFCCYIVGRSYRYGASSRRWVSLYYLYERPFYKV